MKPFLVWTIFCTHQHFCKRYETSKILSTSFGGCKNSVRRENQSVQNAAACLLSLTQKTEQVTPILKELHWLPVAVRIEFKILVLVFKAYHGIRPHYISDMMTKYEPTTSLRSSSKRLLVFPRHKLKTYGRSAFSVNGPMLWNSLQTILEKLNL